MSTRRGDKIWLNGKIVSGEDAKVSLFTHALHYGTGAFEGIRAYRQAGGGGGIFRLREHMQRLHESIKILGMRATQSVDELVEGARAACRANGFEECYLRPIAFLGDGQLGVYVGKDPVMDVAILTWEWGAYLGAKGEDEGARLKISSYVRPHVNSAMTKGKISGQYVNSVLAKREAILAGYDEALLLDPEGYLTEGSGENLFIIRDGIVKTTPLTSILSGITRSTILTALRAEGIPVQEARFTRDELYCVDEVFLTGTAAEITPIASVDDRLIGTGKAGPITKKIRALYADLVRGKAQPEYARGWIEKI